MKNLMTKESGTRGPGCDNLLAEAEAAAGMFKPTGGKIGRVSAYGDGNVHDTFLVVVQPGEAEDFILQRMNTFVFRRPELVMQNIRTVTGHIRGRLDAVNPGRRWDIPGVMLARDGLDHWVGPGGSFWRAMNFIGGARSVRTVREIGHAREVGWALGMFHNLVSDLPAGNLGDTLEGFHVTPLYVERYGAVLSQKALGGPPDVRWCMDFVERRRSWAGMLEEAKARGLLCLRTIHGDPKADNVLLDAATGRAVALIDLDTVKPGLIQYDIGDCLRSCCNPLGEDPGDPDEVRFEPDFCGAVLRGYFSSAGEILSANDIEYVFDSVRLIAFELGLRFFTDYLEGNVYFRVRREEQNLARALVQFKLTESIERQEAAIRKIVNDAAQGR